MDHECSPAGLGGNNIGKHGQSEKDHWLQMVAVDVVLDNDDLIDDGGGEDDDNHNGDGDYEVKSLCPGGMLGEKCRHKSTYQPSQSTSNLNIDSCVSLPHHCVHQDDQTKQCFANEHHTHASSNKSKLIKKGVRE